MMLSPPAICWARSTVSDPTTSTRASARAPSPARSTRETMGIPATVWSGLGTIERIRVPAPAASTIRPTRTARCGELDTVLVRILTASARGRNSAGEVAGGPGFEPGIKVPKTLVIPFHHPPTESTDPTGALTRGWCLPSPEGVYQRLLSDLAAKRRIVRAGEPPFSVRGSTLGIPLLPQRVLHPREKCALAVIARCLGVEGR